MYMQKLLKFKNFAFFFEKSSLTKNLNKSVHRESTYVPLLKYLGELNGNRTYKTRTDKTCSRNSKNEECNIL